jgi:hypothetical protein
MKLTDQEQVILRAIERVGRNGLAEIASVVKAVGYPKATTKKTLISLSNKGAVSLHRHDYPASLKPEQRKLLVRIGRDYFSAVSMRKRNPTKQFPRAGTSAWVVEQARKAKRRGLSMDAALNAIKDYFFGDQSAVDFARPYVERVYKPKKKNPTKSKGKTALKRTGRALKSVARSVLASGSEILGAGAEALNPVRRRVRNKYIDLVIKGRAKKTPQGWKVGTKTFTQGRGTVSVSSSYYLDRHTGMVYAKRARNAAKKRNPEIIWQVDSYNKTAKSAADEFARTYWQEPRKIRGLKPDGTFKVVGGVRTYRVKHDGRLFVIEVVAQNPKRRRNSDKKDSDHPIEVTKHWRAGPPGYLTPWQRAHHAGQSQLFETGIKPAKKRNPFQWHGRSQRVRFISGEYKGKTGVVQSVIQKRYTKEPTVYRIQIDGFPKPGGWSGKVTAEPHQLEAVRENPKHASRSVHPRKKTGRARAVTKARNRSGVRSVAKARKASTKRSARRNPSAESIRKKFAGRVTGERDVFVPGSTPKGKLAKLGNLVLIQTERGTIKPVRGSAVLLADTRGKLHIGTTGKSDLFSGPRQSFGAVKRIEYDSSKPHLGYPSPIIWHHKLGEETGHRPTLHADGQGGLVFRGGRYRLTRRGIEN